MKKWIIVIIILLFTSEIAFSKQTNEVDISSSFLSFSNMVINKNYTNSEKLIDYAVEIVKYKPDSLEAYFTISLMNENSFDFHDPKIFKKYLNIKQQYFSTIEDFTSDPEYKILLLVCMAGHIEANNQEEANNYENQVIEKLKSIQNTYYNENYSPIVMLLLTLDKTNLLEYLSKFKEKFPTHSFIPLVELNLIAMAQKGEEAISSLKNWVAKYGNIKSPFGSTIALEAYSHLFICYFDLRDYNNAKYYADLIEKECPNYYNLTSIKSFLENFNNLK